MHLGPHVSPDSGTSIPWNCSYRGPALPYRIDHERVDYFFLLNNASQVNFYPSLTLPERPKSFSLFFFFFLQGGEGGEEHHKKPAENQVQPFEAHGLPCGSIPVPSHWASAWAEARLLQGPLTCHSAIWVKFAHAQSHSLKLCHCFSSLVPGGMQSAHLPLLDP